MAAPSKTENEGKKFDVSFKILVLGEMCVGKTCFIKRYTEGTYAESPGSTIGIDFRPVFFTLDGVKVRLQIWDTAGQERFRTLTNAYYRGTSGIILLYDITKSSTFNSVPGWFENIKSNAPSEVIIFLCGAKADSQARREVDRDRANKFAESYDMCHMEFSAKTNENVSAVFEKLAKLLLEYRKTLIRSDPFGPNIIITPEEPNAIDCAKCCSQG